MRMGPPKLATKCTSLYDGFGADCPLNAKGRESNAELLLSSPTPPLYRPRPPGRLLPKARACANGEAAPLLTLPLIRSPSAAALALPPPPASSLLSSRNADAAAGVVTLGFAAAR